MMLEPRRVFMVHLAVIGGLVLANLPIAIMDRFGHHGLLGFARLMRLEEEANFPTAVSSLALVACAIAASAIRSRLAQDDLDKSSWNLLAGFFAFLALDEVAMLHEFGNRISFALKLGGILTNIGVFLYIPILVWLAFRLFPFWLRQEPSLRANLFVAASIYVAGAIGFELIENELRQLGYGNFAIPLRASFVFEECGEMLGVAVFLYTFLHRFGALGGGPLIRLAVPDAREQAPRTPPVCYVKRPGGVDEFEPVSGGGDVHRASEDGSPPRATAGKSPL